jgi:dienelactone hydrolase
MIVSVTLATVLAQGLGALGSRTPDSGDFAYKIGNQEFLGYVAKARGFRKSSKVVVVVQDWNGLGDHEKDVCNRLAKEGYTAFAVDVYGKGVRPSGVKDCSAESGKYYQAPEKYMERLTGAMKAFSASYKNSGDRIAIGYCFGGTGVLELARRNLGVQTVVAFHGGLKRLASAKATRISANVVVLHGAADPFIPAEDVKECQDEMKVAKSFKFVSYPGAVHAFTVKSMGFSVNGAKYDEAADKGSWQELMLVLKAKN